MSKKKITLHEKAVRLSKGGEVEIHSLAMKNKHYKTMYMNALRAIDNNESFLVDGVRLKAVPQQTPWIYPCKECKMGVRCDMMTSTLCSYADYLNGQRTILIDV